MSCRSFFLAVLSLALGGCAVYDYDNDYYGRRYYDDGYPVHRNHYDVPKRNYYIVDHRDNDRYYDRRYYDRRDYDGRKDYYKSDKRFHDKYHAPYGVIHRADMLNVIYDACKQSNLIKLATSQKVVSIEDDGSSITARTDTGETHKGAALIGCDGLWSTVREKVVGDGKPVVSGHIAYRAVLPTAEWPKEYRLSKMIVWCGEKTHLVHYPLRRGELFNLVAVFHSDRYEEGWDVYGDPGELERKFANERPEVQRLLAKINVWKMWVLCDREPARHWSKGRATLLGDAAHPTLQYLAQGANMAIEDAVVLAAYAEITRFDWGKTFKLYEDARYKRTARVQIMSRYYGDAYHAAGVVRELRNDVLAPRPGAAPDFEGVAWLYDGIEVPQPNR